MSQQILNLQPIKQQIYYSLRTNNIHIQVMGDKLAVQVKKKKYKSVKKPTTEVSLPFDPSLSSILDDSISTATELSFFQSQSMYLQEGSQYKKCRDLIDQKQHLKQLKKYFKKTIKSSRKIELFYSTRRPRILFQYIDGITQSATQYLLRDLLKANKQGAQEYETISKVFDLIYYRVGENYYKLQRIAVRLAEQQRVELIIDPKLLKVPLLYYQIDGDNINFAIFDCKMRMFEFTSVMVQSLALDKQDQKLWRRFNIEINNSKSANQGVEEGGGEFQVQSDGEKSVYQQDLTGLQSRLNQLLATDCTEYEDEINSLDQKCQQMRQRADHRQQKDLERLSDQVFELQHNLENFVEVRNKVRQQATSRTANLKYLVKRMIVAERQLSSRLPILARKREIFNELDKKDLIILEGQTGSGKSTQLPQMLCEYYNIFNNPNAKPVLITQPRKLATRTVAERVAYEMEQAIGGFVDYATTVYKSIASTAKIIFKLDTVVLDQLTTDRLLSNYCCLIIDEAHERTISIDVILGLVKQLQTKRKNFKVIVTSASLDAVLFSNYFATKVMKVSGRLFPVETIYRSSLEQDIVHKIEKVLKNDILVGNSDMRQQYKGDVLVFCSGVDDIAQLQTLFQKFLNPRVFKVYALHGRIAVNEQKMVFLQTKQHKIIFASRIAETSITINGVRVVVDPGFDRQLVYDQKNRVSSRKLVHISQSSAKQRAGRAGRTSKGYCFRIYSESEFNSFRPNKTPQIDNMALDTLVLRLKSLGISQVQTFSYIKQPDKAALQQSVETLKMIGGLTSAGDITTIGRLLLQLQIEPFLGRSVVEAMLVDAILNNSDFIKREMSDWPKNELSQACGAMMSVVQILCMIINCSNLFSSSAALREHQEEVKFRNFSDQRGDFFFLQRIYNEFQSRQRDSAQALNNWIYKNFLNKKTLFQTKQLCEDILQTIGSFHLDFKDPTIIRQLDVIKFKLKECKSADQIVLSCMMTSFCVNLCLYSQNPTIGYTLILQKKPIVIHGTSTLSLLGIFPKWIVCYDLKTNEKGVTSCTIAHKVDFSFLKNTVQNYVFEKLQLGSAQKMNPFYDTIQRTLPTLILEQIRNQFANRFNNNMALLNYLSIMIKESTSTLSISFPRNLTVQQIFSEEKTYSKATVKQYIQNYLQQKRAKCNCGDIRQHLISNIHIQIANGFKIQRIFFNYEEVEFLIKADRYTLYELTVQFQHLYTYQYQGKLKVITINHEEFLAVTTLLEQYDAEYSINLKESASQSQCNAKVYMHFYTGSREDKSSLLLLFGSSRQTRQIAQRNCQILSQTKKSQGMKPTEQKYKYINIVSGSKFKVARNGNTVNCYNQDVDAFQLQEALQKLCNFGILPFDFKMPTAIRQFRQSQPLLAMKSEKQWQKQIASVFQKHKLINLQIKVKNDKNTKQEQLQQYLNTELLIKTKLIAQISTKNMETLNEIIRKFDGKKNIVGCGKVHFRFNFKQHITKVNKQAFTALRKRFECIRDMLEHQDMQLKIQIQERRFGRVQSVFISCRSPNREKLLRPTEKIKEVFYPYMLRLEEAQFNFLCYSSDGDNLLEAIQDEHNYDIYFGFDRKLGIIKVYCEQDQFQQIQARIDQKLAQYEFYFENISYKGKGLKRVVQLLEKILIQTNIDKRNQQKKLFLEYKIIFRNREIQLYGDRKSLQLAKLQIQKMANEEPGSCHICMKNTDKPYTLFGCRHTFCWKCIGDYIQQLRKDEGNDDPYVCPEDGCTTLINSNDIKTFLSTDQFQSLCLKRVKQFVANSKEYFTCPTTACEQIFQIKKIKTSPSFDCPICGKWFCSTCRQPHQHFSCQEWSSLLQNGELAKFGLRKCKCGGVLQKQMRVKHIKCKQCNQFLCWTCTKTWANQRDCLNHTKVCKK